MLEFVVGAVAGIAITLIIVAEYVTRHKPKPLKEQADNISKATAAANRALELIAKLPVEQREKHYNRVKVNIERIQAKIDAANAMVAGNLPEINNIVSDLEASSTARQTITNKLVTPTNIVIASLLITIITTFAFIRTFVSLSNETEPVVPVVTETVSEVTVPEVTVPVATIEVETIKYVVKKGDTLWDIAHVQYGDPLMWSKVWAENNQQIEDPSLIFPGQVLNITTIKTGVQ